MICTHAILHQAIRELDAAGRVVATIDDYRAVHELLADLLAEQSSSGLSASDREFFESVCQNAEEDSGTKDNKDGGLYVTVNKMVQVFKKDQPWTSRRLRKLAKCGFLIKDSKKREHRYFLADPLPEDAVSILPAPKVIEQWLADNGGQIHTEEKTTTASSPGPQGDAPAAPFDGMTF